MVRRKNRRNRLGRGGRLGSNLRATLDHLFEGVALLMLQVAQLILHVETSLLAQLQQDLGIDVKLARQLVDADFLFLQAMLLFGATDPKPVGQPRQARPYR
jgi:hypothetical protein